MDKKKFGLLFLSFALCSFVGINEVYGETIYDPLDPTRAVVPVKGHTDSSEEPTTESTEESTSESTQESTVESTNKAKESTTSSTKEDSKEEKNAKRKTKTTISKVYLEDLFPEVSLNIDEEDTSGAGGTTANYSYPGQLAAVLSGKVLVGGNEENLRLNDLF